MLSHLPLSLNITLAVQGLVGSRTVEGAGEDLLENTSTFHTDVDRGLFDKLPSKASRHR